MKKVASALLAMLVLTNCSLLQGKEEQDNTPLLALLALAFTSQSATTCTSNATTFFVEIPCGVAY